MNGHWVSRGREEGEGEVENRAQGKDKGKSKMVSRRRKRRVSVRKKYILLIHKGRSNTALIWEKARGRGRGRERFRSRSILSQFSALSLNYHPFSILYHYHLSFFLPSSFHSHLPSLIQPALLRLFKPNSTSLTRFFFFHSQMFGVYLVKIAKAPLISCYRSLQDVSSLRGV